jgi:hypothetical protein
VRNSPPAPAAPLPAPGAALATTLVAVGLGLAACAGSPPQPLPTLTATAPQPDRDRLAGIAAAAEGNAYVATYQLTTPGYADRTVTVAVGTDGSWVIGLPATGLSGLADIAVFRSKDGLFQCLLGPASGTAGVRPDLGPLPPGCVKMPALTPTTDPEVEHVFTDWLAALTDRSTALSVSAVTAPAGVTGSCFSVESTSAALAPPVDPGTYCFDNDNMLTSASGGFGTLRLVGPVAAAPPSVARPAPIVTRAPVPMKAPPAPPPPPTPSASPSPTS